MEIMIKKDF